MKRRKLVVDSIDFYYTISSPTCGCEYCRTSLLTIEQAPAKRKALHIPKHKKKSSASNSSALPPVKQLLVNFGHQYLPSSSYPTLDLLGFVHFQDEQSGPAPLRQLILRELFRQFTPLCNSTTRGPPPLKFPQSLLQSHCLPFVPDPNSSEMPPAILPDWEKSLNNPGKELLLPRPDVLALMAQALTLAPFTTYHDGHCFAMQIKPAAIAHFIQRSIAEGFWEASDTRLKLEYAFQRENEMEVPGLSRVCSCLPQYQQLGFDPSIFKKKKK